MCPAGRIFNGRGRESHQDDGMQKTIALTENRDFVRLYKKGRSYVAPGLVIYISKNRLGINRLGITTGRKLGKAVRRNRAKRIIREAYRNLEPQTRAGYDFVFVSRVRTLSMKSDEVQSIMSRMLSGAGVLSG